MALTDENGDPVDESTLKLPTVAETDQVAAQVRMLRHTLSLSGAKLGPLVELEAKLDALVSLVVPPKGPARRLLDHRTQTFLLNRVAEIAKTVQAAQKEAARPKLEIARDIPTEYLRG